MEQIIDQVRKLEANQLLVLRRALDNLIESSSRHPAEQHPPFRTVAVDMGPPLIDVDKALSLSYERDDERILAQSMKAEGKP